MAISRTAQEMQNCIPYIQALSSNNLDKQSSENKLQKLNVEAIMSIITMMEIGRDHYLIDACKASGSPELIYSKHKRVAIKNHQDKNKDELIHYILTKLLLHRYMETAMSVLGLYKLKN